MTGGRGTRCGQRSQRTQNNREFLVGRAVELLNRAGAKEIYRLNWPPLILHVQSTMRMGANPSNPSRDGRGSGLSTVPFAGRLSPAGVNATTVRCSDSVERPVLFAGRAQPPTPGVRRA